MRKIAGSLLIILLFVGGCSYRNEQPGAINFWTDGYCQQLNVQHVIADMDKIVFKQEGEWTSLPLVDLPVSFTSWNKERRIEFLGEIKKLMMGEGGSGPELAGPHNGIVASCGFRREDSSFSLNNAVKGMGFLPKAEKIDEFLTLLDSTENSPMPQKLAVLEGFYENLEEDFDLDKQVSLELYSKPEFMTQTFLNQVYNPISTIVYLDIPSFKLKTVTRLLDPNDPDLNEYERKVVLWINKIHNYFHGPFNVDFMGVIYYTVEVYDNSPMGRDPETGMGRRIMPPLP